MSFRFKCNLNFEITDLKLFFVIFLFFSSINLFNSFILSSNFFDFSNNKDNSFSNKNKHSKNSSSKHQKQKSKIQTKDSNIPNNNNISNKKSIKKIINKDNIDEYLDITSREKRFNSKNEIMALKKNLQKNNSENILNNKKIDSNEIDKSRINTISCTSSKTKDSNYYLEKCKSLSRYIKQYYQENQKYPSTNLNFYLYGRLIGQGAFGKVNIGLNILAGRVVAIKSFNKKELDKNGDNMKKILYETDLMKKMNHPNITKILEVFEDEDYILITMEYINGGNLFSFVKKRRKLSEKTAKFLYVLLSNS